MKGRRPGRCEASHKAGTRKQRIGVMYSDIPVQALRKKNHPVRREGGNCRYRATAGAAALLSVAAGASAEARGLLLVRCWSRLEKALRGVYIRQYIYDIRSISTTSAGGSTEAAVLGAENQPSTEQIKRGALSRAQARGPRLRPGLRHSKRDVQPAAFTPEHGTPGAAGRENRNHHSRASGVKHPIPTRLRAVRDGVAGHTHKSPR